MASCGCGRRAKRNSTKCESCTSLNALGLEYGAKRDEIKEAYHTLVKVWHPDRFPNDEKLKKTAGQKLAGINAAYQYLSQNPPSDDAIGKGRPSQENVRKSETSSPPPPPAEKQAGRNTSGTQDWSNAFRPRKVRNPRVKARVAIISLIVLLLAAYALIANYPNSLISSLRRHSHSSSARSSKRTGIAIEDHELHLSPRFFGRGAVSDGRTYSVALIDASQKDIPPTTALLVQGIISGQVGQSGFAIRDEQRRGKRLYCGMSPEEFQKERFLFGIGERVQASGSYEKTSDGIPLLQDCRLASPVDKVVRPGNM